MPVQLELLKLETRAGDEMRQLFDFRLHLADGTGIYCGGHTDRLHARQSVCHSVCSKRVSNWNRVETLSQRCVSVKVSEQCLAFITNWRPSRTPWRYLNLPS